MARAHRLLARTRGSKYAGRCAAVLHLEGCHPSLWFSSDMATAEQAFLPEVPLLTSAARVVAVVEGLGALYETGFHPPLSSWGGGHEACKPARRAL